MLSRKIYSRSTRECKFEDLKTQFLHHLGTYNQRRMIDDIKEDVLFCFQTISHKNRLFFSPEVEFSFVCITKKYLYWGTTDLTETYISAAKWIEIEEICDWKNSIVAEFSRDYGVMALGLTNLNGYKGQWFIALSDDVVGNKCIQLLKEFVQPIQKIEEIYSP